MHGHIPSITDTSKPNNYMKNDRLQKLSTAQVPAQTQFELQTK